MGVSSGVNMAVILLGIIAVVVVAAIVIPIVLVVKRKKDRDKTNMNLFNDMNEDKR